MSKKFAPKLAAFPSVDTLTPSQAVVLMLAVVGASRGFFSALVQRGEDFLKAFCPIIAEQVTPILATDENARTADQIETLARIRQAYLQVRAACTDNRMTFTVSSRKGGLWTVIPYEAPAADSPGSNGSSDKKANPLAVELARAKDEIKTLTAALAAMTAERDALAAKLAKRTAPAKRVQSAPVAAIAA
jgi:hypothetical protein